MSFLLILLIKEGFSCFAYTVLTVALLFTCKTWPWIHVWPFACVGREKGTPNCLSADKEKKNVMMVRNPIHLS